MPDKIRGSAIESGTITATQLSNNALDSSIYTLTGDHLDPANGDIQVKTISANTTFTEELSSGESVILQLNGGSSYTVTWMNTTWVTSSGNSAPTLTANDTFVFWKIDTTLYGAYVGSYA